MKLREIKKKFLPIVGDTEVRVPIGDNYITYTIELIREVQEGNKSAIELVNFTNVTNNIDLFHVNHHLGLTLNSYGFRKLFQATEDRVVLQHMKTGKEFYTRRKEPELKKFEAITTGVCNAIERQEFYPVHNSRCRSCIYKDVCDKYKF